MKHLLTTPPPLSIAAFLDSRPGHVKQTRGIVDALALLTPLSVAEVRLPDPNPAAGTSDWCRFFLSCFGLNLVQDHDALGRPLPKSADLVIGTGARAHIPVLLFSRRYGGKTVTCMTPSSIFLRSFDLCCIPEHDRPRPRKNVFTTVGPPNTARPFGPHSPEKGLILVGGEDKKNHFWNIRETLGRIREIIEGQRTVHWAISSSARTPKDMLPLLNEAAKSFPNADFFCHSDTEAGWIEAQYKSVRDVWVTADSASMIYEALTAGCRVGVLPVLWKNTKGKLACGLSSLIEKKKVLPFEMWKRDPLAWPSVPPLNEAGRCAEEILRRWWPERFVPPGK
jgi:hypothetical protein